MNAVVSPAFLSSRNNPHVIENVGGEVEIAVSPQFSARYDRNNAVLWSTWAPRGIPCFNLELLHDLERGSHAIEGLFRGCDRETSAALHRRALGRRATCSASAATSATSSG